MTSPPPKRRSPDAINAPLDDDPHSQSVPADDLLARNSLAVWEKAAEVDSSTPRDSVGAQAKHLHCYRLIDQLASPVRSALQATAAPPELPDYETLKEVGRGGMGVVYRGRNKKTMRYDAIKVIRPDHLDQLSEERRQFFLYRFQQETQLASQVAHEHIVPVYQVGEWRRQPWFSMQFVEGRSLDETLLEQRLSPEQAASALEKIARAIDMVHRRGILHGDIKPHNILLEAETNRPMLTDFGLADLEASDGAQADGGLGGTLAYMAPEFAEALQATPAVLDATTLRTTAADVYSLGATLRTALTGESPNSGGRHDESSPTSSVGGGVGSPNWTRVPPPLQRICLRAMATAPEDRYHSAAELADELTAWLERPRWNRHFPRLGTLLCSVIAPTIVVANLAIYVSLRSELGLALVFSILAAAYAPLFLSFAISERKHAAALAAKRELWAVWSGHCIGSLSGFASLAMLFPDEPTRVVNAFYPLWGALSALTFFSKSGNFWRGYVAIGAIWGLATLLMGAVPRCSPLLFGLLGPATCVAISLGDHSFRKEE